MADIYKSYILSNTDDNRVMYQSLDENGVILDIDQNWLNFMGYMKKDVIGKFFGEFVTLSSFYKLEQHFNDLKKYGKITDIRFKMKKRDGTAQDAILNAISVHDEREVFRRLDTILSDIDLFNRYEHSTEADQIDIVNRLQVKLKNYNQFIQKLLDSQTNILAVIENNRIIYTNRSLLHFFRATSLEELNKTIGSLSDRFEPGKGFHVTKPAAKKQWIDAISRLDDSGRVVYMRDPQGVLHAFRVDIHTIELAQNKRYILGFIDITQTLDYQTSFNNAVEQKISEVMDKETLLGETEEIANIGSWEWNSLTKKIRLSKGISHIFGINTNHSSLSFRRLYRYIHPDDRKMVYLHLKNILTNKNDTDFVCRIIKDAKSVRYIKVIVRIKNPHAHIIRAVGVISDVSDQYKTKEELSKEHQLLQTMIDGIDYSVMMINPDYTIELMNKAARESIDPAYITDMQHPKCYEISQHRTSPCDDADHPCPMMDVINSGTPSTVLHSHQDGTFTELLAAPLRDEQGNIYAITESERDITSHMQVQNELRMQKQVLSFQAEHDALTGLPNRTLFFDRLNQSIKKSRRIYTKSAVMFIDLDHFKEINDDLGHAAGDKVLIEVAGRLHNSIREVDTLARLAGDEFTIILESITNMQDVAEIANKILHTFQKPIHIDGTDQKVTTSIGISIFPDDGNTPEELLQNADTAMYKAKNSGKNKYHYYASEMTERVFERSVTESCLRHSVYSEELIIYYQPQIDAQTNKITGIEALVRWDLADMGIILPSQFMPLAEESILQRQIDSWVMKHAMAQIARWYQQGLKPGQLSLNLSMDQLHDKNFLIQLETTLSETGCRAEWLVIELKEEQILKDPEKTITRLQQIRDLGVGLAIDDFGVGTTSLAHLIRLPVTKLKIDHSFVRYIPESQKDVDLVRSVIALTKSINLKVIAKGVETYKQKEFLMQEGCQNLQGFLYGQPMPAEKMSQYLLKNEKGISSVA